MASTKRQFTSLANSKIKELLLSLRDGQKTSVYRNHLFLLGMNLGINIIKKKSQTDYFYLISTVEDADFLAKGIIEILRFNDKKFNFACFWNHREFLGEEIGSISPAIRKYIEPCQSIPNKTMIIVKSIISGGCVVKTNIKESIKKINPSKIFITAPIMHKDAPNKLKKEFSKNIANKFEFIHYAIDSERSNDGLVRPGIGNVYKLLGFKDQNHKNRSTPSIVKERRSLYLKS